MDTPTHPEWFSGPSYWPEQYPAYTGYGRRPAHPRRGWRGRVRGAVGQWPRTVQYVSPPFGEQSRPRSRSRDQSDFRQERGPGPRSAPSQADRELSPSRVDRLENNFERLIEALNKRQ